MKHTLSILICLLISPSAFAKSVRYELTVRNEKVNLSGKKEVDFALTVNGGIPAPTLEFTEGDDAEILVKNGLGEEEVSIHWHGLLLPPEEDGVPYVNTPPIFPGKERLFKFKIRQNGTYWYHSHTGVQEQKGVYGAIVIHPKKSWFNMTRMPSSSLAIGPMREPKASCGTCEKMAITIFTKKILSALTLAQLKLANLIRI